MSFLGLDVGTQSVRAALIGRDGAVLGFASCPITTDHPRPSWAEQDPSEWWQAARSAVGGAVERAGISVDQIAGIGLDCTACTVVATDIEGKPLRPALLWMDQRSIVEADIISSISHPNLAYVSGRVSPEWMLPKALWLKRQEPEIYDRAARIVECTNLFMYWLTGGWTLSLNHAAVKWNYSTRDGGWPISLMKTLGIEDLLERWPVCIETLGQGGATLSRQAAEWLGLREGTPVAQGGIDAYLGMIGLGATGEGDLAAIVGSSTCHLSQGRTAVLGSGASGCFPDATVNGLYTIEAGQTATGSLLDWYRRHFLAREEGEANASGVSVYEWMDRAASEIPPGCEGVTIREDFQGNRSPYKNPKARGAITGLSLGHGPAHIFRALYEATACGTRQVIEDLVAHGLPIERVFFGGGGAKSALWTQIHADTLDRPIRLPREVDACALGAAMAGAVGAGEFRDFDEAASAMVRIDRVVDPITENRSRYEDLYGRYVTLYEQINR